MNQVLLQNTCEKCNNTGSIAVVARNERGYQMEPCDCPYGQVMEAERKQRNVYRIRGEAGLPKRFMDYTLESSPIAAQYPVIQAWIDENSVSSLFLWGEHGVGKTGLAIGIINAIIDRAYVEFTTVPDMLERIRAAYKSEETTVWALVQVYSGADVLVLDDLGKENVSGFVEEKLYQIIGKRHDEAAPTIFTSNLNLEETGNRIGAATTWRILEMCGANHIVEIKGPNLRDVKHAAG